MADWILNKHDSFVVIPHEDSSPLKVVQAEECVVESGGADSLAAGST